MVSNEDHTLTTAKLSTLRAESYFQESAAFTGMYGRPLLDMYGRPLLGKRQLADAAQVSSGHVSGPLMREIVTAGQQGLRGSGSNHPSALL